MTTFKVRWFYLALFCIVNLFAGSYYAWSVFAGPLAERLSAATASGVTPADLGAAFAVASAVNPLAMVVGGWANDRFGPRCGIALGGLLIGSGLFLSATVSTVTELVIAYGLIFGFGVGLTYTSTIGSALKYFPDKRGLAGGIATMSYGLSAIILPPVASALIIAEGISQTLQILGILTGAVILTGGLLSRRCPDNILTLIGCRPAGQGFAPLQATEDGSKNWRQMLATPMFWAMLLFFVAASTGALMLISSASTIAQNQIGLDVGTAALAVSLIALMNACGRFAAGCASDLLGRIPTLFICIASEAAGLACLLVCSTGSTALFFCGISLIGLCYGGFVGIYPGFTADQFGSKFNSVNYGFMAAGFSSAGIVGPMILRAFADGSNYAPAYWCAMAVCGAGLVFGALCIFLQRKAVSPDREQGADRRTVSGEYGCARA